MDYFSIFIQMLQAKGVADNTIRSYKTYIKPYLSYLSAHCVSPDDASWQTMREFLLWIQSERSLCDRTVNMIISYLQFFHIYVLHKPWDRTQIPFRKFNTYLPFVPMPDIIWKMILSYYLSLPTDRKPDTWLFTQQYSICNPMDSQWMQKIVLAKRKELGMNDKLTCHSFRHAYATHCYENGMDLLALKTFLGHKSLNSTTIYIHLAASSITKTPNPFEQIGGVFLG